jgi:hypothetical protein
MTESGVTVHHETTTDLDVDTAMLWQQLGAELTGLVDDPSSVTLVVTDQMPAVISKLGAKVPWEFGGPQARRIGQMGLARSGISQRQRTHLPRWVCVLVR